MKITPNISGRPMVHVTTDHPHRGISVAPLVWE